MLSIASVKSSSGAANYFAKDDYYTGEHASEVSAWGGEGAAALGLSGEVSKEAFEQILNGVLPNGDKVAQVENRRLGVDLTFSMPKSASVMAYVAGDDRVLAAHLKAVQATMGWVEKNAAEARTYERNRNGEPVRTGNLVYAIFQHDTSRALDPQGHLHVVVAAITNRAGQGWRALWNGELWKNNAVIGSAYHALFRAELGKIGYATTITGKHGQFEIDGVPKAVRDVFSQRRETINAKADELGVKSHAARDRVTANTRDAKLDVEDRQALRDGWREKAAELGFDGRALMAQAAERAGSVRADMKPGTVTRIAETLRDMGRTLGDLFHPRDPLVDRGLDRLRATPVEVRAQHAVASAVRILEQREAAFRIHDVTKAAIDLGLRGVTADVAAARVDALVRSGHLLPGTSDRIDGVVTHVTTPRALEQEKKLLAGVEQGKDASVPIGSPATAVERLQAITGDQPLNAGQLAAATLLLATTDRIVAVQGVAGAGKTTMIQAVARAAEAEGMRVVGLAFQNKMVGDLRDGAGIDAQTLSSFVNSYARAALAGSGELFDRARAELKNTVLLLDESSMVANEPMLHLVRIANALGVDRLAMIGDRQQLSAIDAGKGFALVQDNGIATARMDENLRQRDPQLRIAAALANRGEAREALAVLGANVVETPRHVATAAASWIALPPAERERTELFASGRAARAELNRHVQLGLQQDGTLKGEGRALTVLEQVNATREEMRHLGTYQSGMILEVARRMPELGLRAGRYEVMSSPDYRGRVALAGERSWTSFDPARIAPTDKRDLLSLYERQDLRLHEGDRVRWTKNDKMRGLDNAALARVVEVTSRMITVETAAGDLVKLAQGDRMLERMGLAYALNMHMAQGVTAERGIAVMSAGEQHLASQRLFNVIVTRVRDGIALFTDDKAALARQLERNPGDKSSALETVGQTKADKAKEMPTLSPGEYRRYDPSDMLAKPPRSGSFMDIPGVEKNPEASRIPERFRDFGR